jgi:hypothetical protein
VNGHDRSSRSPNDHPILPFAEPEEPYPREGLPPLPLRGPHLTRPEASLAASRRQTRKRWEQQLSLPLAEPRVEHPGSILMLSGQAVALKAQFRTLTTPVSVVGPATAVAGKNDVTGAHSSSPGGEDCTSATPREPNAGSGHGSIRARGRRSALKPAVAEASSTENNRETPPKPHLRVIPGGAAGLPALLLSTISADPPAVREEVTRLYLEDITKHPHDRPARNRDSIEKRYLTKLRLLAREAVNRALFE